MKLVLLGLLLLALVLGGLFVLTGGVDSLDGAGALANDEPSTSAPAPKQAPPSGNDAFGNLKIN
jgi:hypothetical protein